MITYLYLFIIIIVLKNKKKKILSPTHNIKLVYLSRDELDDIIQGHYRHSINVLNPIYQLLTLLLLLRHLGL